MKTAMQQLIEHVELDKRLKNITERYATSLIWYIETYFIEIEKAQIMDAREDGLYTESNGTISDINKSSENYYNQKFQNK